MTAAGRDSCETIQYPVKGRQIVRLRQKCEGADSQGKTSGNGTLRGRPRVPSLEWRSSRISERADTAKDAAMCRILVVDDIRHVRRAIGGWLKRCGFRVAIADGNSNGLTALDDSRFDLMIVIS